MIAKTSTDVHIRRASSITVAWDNALFLTEALIDPLVLSLSLWAVAYAIEDELRPPYLILSLIVFSLTFPGSSRMHLSAWRLLRNVVAGWLGLAGLLLFLGYATRYSRHFDQEAIAAWLWVAPLTQLMSQGVFRLMAPHMKRIQSESRRAVIVGVNENGRTLAQRIEHSPYVTVKVLGYFDDRSRERIGDAGELPLLGKLDELAGFVKEQGVNVIYLSLPMANQPRILALLDALRDTTASVYFVPDMFVTELIQGRMDTVGDMPVVAVCESPFTGFNGLIKRASDVVLAALIVVLIAPLMLIIAVAVKLTSPGPVIFQQRRYGLDGREIWVYKFRSMTVCEDGAVINQAQRQDSRVTPLGAFLRSTSLDELPQFINVLQGRMSIVGPRPHAVAHNETYRKLIKGYMVRHKVKPGITGWAQVNGFRGETETLDKMEGRVRHDLDYLRHWSLKLDLFIIFKTLWLVVKRQEAY
jgi:putative colanic acid biosynthesis UDP-glucose lipid carrier transferase